MASHPKSRDHGYVVMASISFPNTGINLMNRGSLPHVQVLNVCGPHLTQEACKYKWNNFKLELQQF